MDGWMDGWMDGPLFGEEKTGLVVDWLHGCVVEKYSIDGSWMREYCSRFGEHFSFSSSSLMRTT